MSDREPLQGTPGRLVRRALRTRRGRGALAAAGIGTSVLLVLVLFGTYRNVEVGIDEYIGQPGIDLWVAPRGTDNLVRSASLLPDVVVEDIGGIAGVREAAPVLRSFMSAERLPGPGAAGGRLTLLALGYRAPSGLGGPAHVVAGRAPSGIHEIVLDRAAAHRLRVHIGDEVLLNGGSMTITGLTARTNVVSTQFVFLDAERAGALSGYAGSASFVAVGLRPGAQTQDVVRRIENEFPGVAVFSREAFLRRNQEEVFAGFRPIQVLVSAIGLVTASVLVALLVLATVEDRRRDIAVLLALGASVPRVAAAMVSQTMRLVLAGVAAGTLTALLLATALNAWFPTVETSVRIGDVAAVSAAFLAVALGGALLPVVRLRRTDPAEAFRP